MSAQITKHESQNTMHKVQNIASVHRLPNTLCIRALCLVLCAFLCAFQTKSASTPWQSRLEALKPDAPSAYFELAEEIADQATEPTHRDLAKHLFALAGALEPHRLGRSACLALADLEDDALAKRRYLALAWLIGSQESGPSQQFGSFNRGRLQSGQPSASAIIGMGETFSHFRKGDGTQAQKTVRNPGTIELLHEYSRHVPGRAGAAGFIEDLKLYRGQTRPSLTGPDISRMLRFEAALLAGQQRSWSQEMMLNDARPLIEVDPSHLAESLGVDAGLALYRTGKWVAR